MCCRVASSSPRRSSCLVAPSSSAVGLDPLPELLRKRFRSRRIDFEVTVNQRWLRLQHVLPVRTTGGHRQGHGGAAEFLDRKEPVYGIAEFAGPQKLDVHLYRRQALAVALVQVIESVVERAVEPVFDDAVEMLHQPRIEGNARRITIGKPQGTRDCEDMGHLCHSAACCAGLAWRVGRALRAISIDASRTLACSR